MWKMLTKKKKRGNEFMAKIKICTRNTFSSEQVQVQNNENLECALNHKAILQIFKKNKYVFVRRGV